MNEVLLELAIDITRSSSQYHGCQEPVNDFAANMKYSQFTSVIHTYYIYAPSMNVLLNMCIRISFFFSMSINPSSKNLKNDEYLVNVASNFSRNYKN